MARYLVAVQYTDVYAVSAASADDALDVLERVLADEGPFGMSCVTSNLDVSARRDPPIMLPRDTHKEYRAEYYNDKKQLVYTHTMKRTTAHAAREHARTVADAVAEIAKCKPAAVEMRLRECEPLPMYRRTR